jgi:hypothetical protein
MRLSPIVIFIYNRSEEFRNCLLSLVENSEFAESNLIVFADGAKPNATEKDLENIQKTRGVLNERAWSKNIQLFVRESNMGLSESIIQGVKQVLEVHNSVIVLEDDLICGRFFLKYMNDALQKYELNDKIAQVSAFMYPINIQPNNESFLIPLTTTLGWGTWKRVWDKVNFYPTDTHLLHENKKMRKRFDLDGHYPYYKMLCNQLSNSKYGSWGILFYWDVFKANRFTVHPDYSLVQHRDKNMLGTHSANYDFLDHKDWNNNYAVNIFREKPESNIKNLNKIKKYVGFYNSKIGRVFRYIKTPKTLLFKIKSIFN